MATEEGPLLSAAASTDTEEQAAMAERQHRAAEIEEARVSGADADDPQLRPRRRLAFAGWAQVGEAAERGEPAATSNDDAVGFARIRRPSSRWQLSAGSMISASLLTGLNSDIPGMVVAQVTEPAFDSATGRAVLVPQGSRLLGRYDHKVAFGQRQAMVLWERLVLPDGSSLALDSAPATDAAGYSGVADGVDFHTWRLLKGIGMSTLLGVGTELRFDDDESGLVPALRESVLSNANRAGQRIVERNLDIAPTITVRPRLPVRLLVHKDLVLPPWRG